MLEIMVILIAIALTFSISSNIRKCILIKKPFHSEMLREFAERPEAKELVKNQFYKQCALIFLKLCGIIAITAFLINNGV